MRKIELTVPERIALQNAENEMQMVIDYHERERKYRLQTVIAGIIGLLSALLGCLISELAGELAEAIMLNEVRLSWSKLPDQARQGALMMGLLVMVVELGSDSTWESHHNTTRFWQRPGGIIVASKATIMVLVAVVFIWKFMIVAVVAQDMALTANQMAILGRTVGALIMAVNLTLVLTLNYTLMPSSIRT